MDNKDLEAPVPIDYDLLIAFLESIELNQDITEPNLPDIFNESESLVIKLNHKFNSQFQTPVIDKAKYNSVDIDKCIKLFKEFSFLNLHISEYFTYKDILTTHRTIKIPYHVLQGLFGSLAKNCELLMENPSIGRTYPKLFFNNKNTNDTDNYIFKMITIINKIKDINNFEIPVLIEYNKIDYPQIYYEKTNEDTKLILKKYAFEKILSNIQKLLIYIEENISKASYDTVFDNIINDFEKTIIELTGLCEPYLQVQKTSEKQFSDVEEINKQHTIKAQEINEQQSKLEKLILATHENLKKSQEALTYSMQSAYSVQQQKLLKYKKWFRAGNYVSLVLLVIGISVLYVDNLNNDLLTRTSICSPFIFLLYVVFRSIRELDKSIAHYEHKLSTNELLKIYLSENENFKDKALIEQSILNVVTLRPDNNNSSDDSLIPYLKELKEFIKTKDKT